MLNEPTIRKEIHHDCTHTYKRISWTAIFIGALVGLGLGFLLNLFGFKLIPFFSRLCIHNNGAQPSSK